jgi:hypothetical protein
MDINVGEETWVRNLLTAVRFLDEHAPLAGRGCWAYPDMLEIAYLTSFEWNRAHFGAWCIMSAPLVLGFDLLDAALFDSVWAIISNHEAIQVNQRWAGHPGRLVRSWTPPGASKSNNWPKEFHKWGGVKHEGPLEALQLWAKPQPSGALAFLVINVDAHSVDGLDFEVSLMELGLPPASFRVRDIWQRKDVGMARGGEIRGHVGARDSAFMLLTPVAPPSAPPPYPPTPPPPPSLTPSPPPPPPKHPIPARPPPPTPSLPPALSVPEAGMSIAHRYSRLGTAERLTVSLLIGFLACLSCFTLGCLAMARACNKSSANEDETFEVEVHSRASKKRCTPARRAIVRRREFAKVSSS